MTKTLLTTSVLKMVYRIVKKRSKPIKSFSRLMTQGEWNLAQEQLKTLNIK